MLERHEVLRSGIKVDKDWWYAVKFGAMIVGALVAAYLVHLMLV